MNRVAEVEMASRFAERSIPHIRDIFGLSSSSNSAAGKNQVTTETSLRNGTKSVPEIAKPTALKSHGQGSDSAISVDSSEEEFGDGRRGRRKSRRGRDASHKRGSSACTRREMAEEDAEEFRHLERHLSMKKTIRKRIMRELQGAMVEDPSEFCAERRSAAISAHSLTFRRGRRGGPPPIPKTAANDNSEETIAVEQPGFLDMLRLADHDADSGNDSPTRVPPIEGHDSSTAASKRHIYDSYRQMSSFRLAMPAEDEADAVEEDNEEPVSTPNCDKPNPATAPYSKKSFWKRIINKTKR
ncbi:unnamed protein product [Notodromas monacha]|uniref:Uncharacterized protein n=1 Tax=Notodromas monacha TaxID=399045 RepID=A0A7R9BEG1_9CRUS|nr:unnamed protein product [Notodromas monacha]CAG0912662.1 unnamed protein product [Notodromas monacha]